MDNYILLTGASGFAGAHMLKLLVEKGVSHIYCPVTYRHGGHPNRITSLINPLYRDQFSLINLDLAEENSFEYFKDKQISLVINFASESHVDRSIKDPAHFVSNNVNLMTNLLEYGRRNTTRVRVIHVSTDEVYGAIDSVEINSEWVKPYFPSNPYSASKAAQESLAISYFKTFGIDINILNITNMIGESQNQEKFIPKVIRKIIQNEIINIDTDSSGVIGSRKYVYVGDVAEAVCLIADESRKKVSHSSELPEKFHISGEKDFTNLEIVNLVAKILGKAPKISISESPRKGYDVKYALSSNKIRNLGWTNTKTIEDRLGQIVNWTLEHSEWLVNDHSSI